MKIAVNCISSAAIPTILQLYRDSKIDFCELMVDNFIHCHPDAIRRTFSDMPLSLHMVNSHFIEKNIDDVTELGNYLRQWIKQLDPVYVSDHIVRFYDASARLLPLIQEFNYETDDALLKERVECWQSLLDCKIFFENHASMTQAGAQQPLFYADLCNITQAGLLYDISNACIADINGICAKTAWSSQLATVKHFHVAGFRYESNLAVDTHDRPLADTVLTYMAELRDRINPDATIVIEVDTHLDYARVVEDIEKVRAILC